ncbi:hypothetical protein F2P56_014589 [Juglans regia]|uniref:Auxin-responsive protein SAUR32-like n=1 Tax=Juglans regia TaxID=51240 RepID=A0A833XDL0_JUGRE|nr:hypothetical protein F2P56_014589 [Juglans regia]
MRDVPKGCLAIKVGQGEKQQRFVVPVMYFNHPLFMQLLKEAEEEYGFDQKGTITIPCHVEEFRKRNGKENSMFFSSFFFVFCFLLFFLEEEYLQIYGKEAMSSFAKSEERIDEAKQRCGPTSGHFRLRLDL